MYISTKELSSLQFIVDQFQSVVSQQADGQNELFPSGTTIVQESINDAYAAIKAVEEREIKKKANRLVNKILTPKDN